ncbi:MAG: hypothetical protein A3J66_02325 [Candidatus Magasanikbacteria bacterium RIFCSPHIGHO2_02_FULL_47_14]|uniref:AAA+ ATPase domain-containing protein n=1 Tax=Candidatus Magasanikbacteria bacterium RIFCSPHIGHO2_02_FULL_47_14 TaxID=1798680 RepID=A0A1F6M1D4_9BACT|nr:MAG: hypothetical protein A3J66_02325 [Candidatus Magasanikbacteria bacterium RIFCSPHIGHO2_02_FULL_47_14]
MPDVASFLNPDYIQVAIFVLVGFAVYQFITIKKPQWSFSALADRTRAAKSGSTPHLDSYATDFTRLAQLGQIDPVIGRHDEIIRLAQVLARREKNNALLIGPPGVGKTAIVEALAQRIISGEIPETLQNKRVLALDISGLMSGTKYRGEFEQRAKRLVKEIENSHRSIILFIDEIHSIIQSQGTEGAINFSDILKPALARGDLQMIGATTWMEYEKYIKTDPGLERRFQPIMINQPSEQETVDILQGIKQKFEEYHKVEFTDAALRKAVEFTSENIKYRTFPDKAIDAMDEAASLVRVSHLDKKVVAVLYEAAAQKYPELKALWQEIQACDMELAQAKQGERSGIQQKREELEKRMEKQGVLVVDTSDVENVVNQWIKE